MMQCAFHDDLEFGLHNLLDGPVDTGVGAEVLGEDNGGTKKMFSAR